MSTIRSATGEFFALTARTIVGRAAACGLRLDSPRVSGEHAVIMWTGTTWQVRDLGSRNGTVVDGRRLEPGEAVVTSVGSRVAFGDQVFEWLQAAAPVAAATSDTGRRAVADGGVLPIPDRDDPEVIVFWRPGGWVMEDEAGLRPAVAEVRVQGERWRLELPEAFEATVEDTSLRLAEVRVRLAVSRDEEYVVARWDLGGRSVLVESRAHHYLLVTLARLRLAEPEDGWVATDDLCRMLALDRRALNVQVFRARHELADLGVQDAASLVERRPGALLRLGMLAVELASL
ncbi:MAG: FHA domain-containing protein [Myxococcales bacterium]|nr:FHA domain-containing protein [Myxococcales bacterium]MCB9548721.1 FHA domain-containing protein [Myxococcales bacterium]